MSDFLDRVRKYMGKMESPRRAASDDQDSHAVVFNAAIVLLHGFLMTESDAKMMLSEYCQRSDEPWSEREIQHKISSAARANPKQERGWLVKGKSEARYESPVKSAPKKQPLFIPKYSAEKLESVVRSAPVAAEDVRYFMERSPVDPRGVTAAAFLDAVFSPGDRVLVFTSMMSQGDFLHVAKGKSYRLAAEQGVQAVTSELPKRSAEGVWYLNNPVSGQWVANAEGKFSRRSEGNIMKWKHWVMESDEAPEKLWLRFLSIVPQAAIKAIYSSGGRSWHALVACDYKNKASMDAELARGKRSLPLLGADPGALTALRLTRLPGCQRGMREQRLIYLDPDANGEDPICLKPRLRTL